MNYTGQGMPVAGVDGKGRFYREAECRDWIKANKPGFKGDFGPGGKRSGAGRKGDKTKDAEQAAVDADIDSVGGGGAVKALFGDDAKRRAVLADVIAGMDPLELVATHAIGPTLARSIAEMFAAQKAYLAVEEQQGRLLKKEDAEAAWMDTLLKVNEAMTGIAPGVAAALAAELGLDARGQDLVRVKVEMAVERARGLLRA